MVNKIHFYDGLEINLLCETLSVSRAGYYAWAKREPSCHEQTDQLLLAEIKEIYDGARGVYGSPRIYDVLRERGRLCSEKRVARLMQENGIVAKTVKKFKPRTTDSNHDGPIADRLFKIEDVDPKLMRPNQVWASDITYVETQEGWLYLAIFLDVFTRKVVGFYADNHMRAELVTKALLEALSKEDFDPHELVTHSDRGVQYASEEYVKLVNEVGMVRSMSRKGNCYDNAYAESFFHSLKTELVYQRRFKTRDEAKQAIFEYIEVFYNRQRKHSSIGYMTPEEFEITTSAA